MWSTHLRTAVRRALVVAPTTPLHPAASTAVLAATAPRHGTCSAAAQCAQQQRRWRHDNSFSNAAASTAQSHAAADAAAASAVAASSSPAAAAVAAAPRSASGGGGGSKPRGTTASSSRPSPPLPAPARLLYRSLLRVCHRFERRPALKAGLVHPACGGLEGLQEEADQAAQAVHDLSVAAREAARRAAHHKDASSGSSGSESLWTRIPSASSSSSSSSFLSAHESSSSSPFAIIGASTTERWKRSISGEGVPLGQKLYWKWLDRFFRRPLPDLLINAPHEPVQLRVQQPDGHAAPHPPLTKAQAKRLIAAKSDAKIEAQKLLAQRDSSTALALPSPRGTVVPFYYLPSRSLVAAVRAEFRAVTRAPSAAQWTHLLSGGFQVLRYLHEQEQLLAHVVRHVDRVPAQPAGLAPLDAEERAGWERLMHACYADPSRRRILAPQDEEFGLAFYHPLSSELVVRMSRGTDPNANKEEEQGEDEEDDDVDEDDDDAELQQLEDHNLQADEAALPKQIGDGSTGTIAVPSAAAVGEALKEKEQWEVDLEALEADVAAEIQQSKKLKEGKTALSDVVAPAPAAAEGNDASAALVASDVSTAPVTALETAAALHGSARRAAAALRRVPSLEELAKQGAAPPFDLGPQWNLRPTKHLRAGSMLVAHPALSTPEFHQAVLLITRVDLQADVVEAVQINRPLDGSELRSHLREEEEQDHEQEQRLLALQRRGEADAQDIAEMRELAARRAAKHAYLQTLVDGERGGSGRGGDATPASPAEAWAAGLAAGPLPDTLPSGKQWDLHSLAARFPGALMYGGPVRRRAGDEPTGGGGRPHTLPRPTILHRRRDWLGGPDGTAEEKARRAARRSTSPLIPAVFNAPDAASVPAAAASATTPVELAPAVFEGDVDEFAAFLGWRSESDDPELQLASASTEQQQQPVIAAETDATDAVPELPVTSADTTDAVDAAPSSSSTASSSVQSSTSLAPIVPVAADPVPAMDAPFEDHLAWHGRHAPFPLQPLGQWPQASWEHLPPSRSFAPLPYLPALDVLDWGTDAVLAREVQAWAQEEAEEQGPRLGKLDFFGDRRRERAVKRQLKLLSAADEAVAQIEPDASASADAAVVDADSSAPAVAEQEDAALEEAEESEDAAAAFDEADVSSSVGVELDADIEASLEEDLDEEVDEEEDDVDDGAAEEEVAAEENRVSVPVSSLRSWDFLLYFGCSTWTPAALVAELAEGTWLLMEGSSAHVFTQRIDVDEVDQVEEEDEDEDELDEDEDEFEEDDEGHWDQAAEELSSLRSAMLRGRAAPPKPDAHEHAPLSDSTGQTAATADDVGAEGNQAQQEVMHAAWALDSALLLAESASAAHPLRPRAPPVPLLPMLLSHPTPALRARVLRLRADLKSAWGALQQCADAPEASEQTKQTVAKLQRERAQRLAEWGRAAKQALHASALMGNTPPASHAPPAHRRAHGDVSTRVSSARAAESAISDAILERRLALLDRALDCAEQSYPMPLPAEFQRAVSSPYIPERVAEALHAYTQQRQQQAQIPATTTDKPGATTAADAAPSPAEPAAAFAVADTAAASAPSTAVAPAAPAAPVASAPLPYPPVLFPADRLWNHALWRRGGEVRWWSRLPTEPFDDEPAAPAERDDDDAFDEDEDEDDRENEQDDDEEEEDEDEHEEDDDDDDRRR